MENISLIKSLIIKHAKVLMHLSVNQLISIQVLIKLI